MLWIEEVVHAKALSQDSERQLYGTQKTSVDEDQITRLGDTSSETDGSLRPKHRGTSVLLPMDSVRQPRILTGHLLCARNSLELKK